jgi:hypothetical protein
MEISKNKRKTVSYHVHSKREHETSVKVMGIRIKKKSAKRRSLL